MTFSSLNVIKMSSPPLRSAGETGRCCGVGQDPTASLHTRKCWFLLFIIKTLTSHAEWRAGEKVHMPSGELGRKREGENALERFYQNALVEGVGGWRARVKACQGRNP